MRLSANRLLSWAKSGAWNAAATLTWKDNENQILGVTIDTASRRLSIFDLSPSRTQATLGGQLNTTYTRRNGLDLFDAFDDDTAPAGSAVGQYTANLFEAVWQRGWQVDGQALALTSQLSAQHSNDKLFGSEQFSLGGFVGVRGTRDSLLFGNRGLQWSNTLYFPSAWTITEGIRVTPYLGLDAGHIFAQSLLDIEGGTLASYSPGSSFNSPLPEHRRALQCDRRCSRPFIPGGRGITFPSGPSAFLVRGVFKMLSIECLS